MCISWLASILTILVLLQGFGFSIAQARQRETVWGAVILTLHGDSTPNVSPNVKFLSPLGARELLSSGDAARRRYSNADPDDRSSSTRIRGLSPSLMHHQVSVLATRYQHVAASAQAFMQGLYPPLQDPLTPEYLASDLTLVNDAVMDFPFNGYQYPLISTFGEHDPGFVQLSGNTNCPKYTSTVSEFRSMPTNGTAELLIESGLFYSKLYPRILFTAFGQDSVNIGNSYDIYQFLNYQYIHNSTAKNIITDDDLEFARHLASRWLYTTNGNVGADGHIFSIAGKTMAYNIVRSLQSNIKSKGSSNKLTMIFTDPKPMMAFASLSGLPNPNHSNFRSLPNPGASMIIELFSMEETPFPSYPSSETSLMVRVLLRNGTNTTDASTPFVAYSMFGLGPSNAAISYKEFVNKIVPNMLSASGWCVACESNNPFCPKFQQVGDPDRGPADSILVIACTSFAWLFIWGCIMLIRHVYTRGCVNIRKLRSRGVNGQLFPICSSDHHPSNYKPGGSIQDDTHELQSMGRQARIFEDTDGSESLISPSDQPVKIREYV
ncbi:hypothetical protein FQN57_003213 [Myotisia sp. PD_48]|nr:hypothetical protein FQN57_003213 [Myotisia sp. PD_48]